MTGETTAALPPGAASLAGETTDNGKTAAQLRELNSCLEEKVRERTSELLELSSNIPGLFYFVDTDGRFVFSNKSYADLFFHTPEELVGKTVREVIGEELYKVAGPRFARAMKGEEAVYTNTLRRPGMADRYYRARYSPRYNAAGQVVGAFLLAIDITLETKLERAVAEAADREREAVARDLHDGVCQELTAISFLSSAMEQRLREENHPEVPAFAELGRLIRATMEKTRSVAHGLSFSSSACHGLHVSLTRLFQSMPCPSCRISLRFLFDQDSLGSETSGHLYLICREAVTNALKHGSPTRIQIRISRSGDHVRLIVADNGSEKVSIPGDSGGMGIRTMSYRARLLGGTLVVSTRRRRPGAIVFCQVPLA